jgi:hypothetical protein
MTLDQLINAYKAVHDGLAPDTTVQARLQYFANLSQNYPTDAAAMSYIVNSADNTTALAALSYQFFTGKAPTKPGLDYLVNSPANPSDLNDGYYSGFNIENRYINFAANLGVAGEGAGTFANKYAALSFADYVASIYQTIIGSSYANAAGIDPAKAIADIVARKDAILATAQGSGLITPNMTAAQIDLALKAATAGYLLGEAIKADVGVYASAANSFMVAMATGTATYGADIITTYAKPAGVLGSGGGQAVSPGFNFPAPVVDTPPATTTPAAPVPSRALTTSTADSLTGTAADETFTGTFGAGATYQGTDLINGGGGTDTLSLTGSSTTLAVDAGKLTSIEVLKVRASTQALTVDMGGGIEITQVINDGSTSDVTFTNQGGLTHQLTLTNTGAVTTNFFVPSPIVSSGADVFTLTLDTVANSTVVVGALAGGITNVYETINIVSTGSSGNIVTVGAGADETSLTAINISGSANLDLRFATDNIRNTATINAGAFTGNLTVTAGTIANTITGGSGNDVITLGAQGVNALSGADVIATNGGSDTVRFVGAVAGGTGASTDVAAFAKVTDFAVASDKLAFSANNGDFKLTPTGGTVQNGLAKGAVGGGLTSGDTMVVQSVVQSAATTVATTDVSFIKLATGVVFHTDIKTTFADALGTASITGLAANGNYLVSLYDTTHSQIVIAVVNVGGNANNDDNLFANDFVNATVSVVGVLNNMTAGDYTAFGAGHLGAAF